MIRSNNYGFTHIYSSTNDLREDASNKKKLTFVLLHGTGGNEEDLMFLGKEIEHNASLLSPRGKVLENVMPRFFRRLSEGVFDLEDLKFRTYELADFIQNCSSHYEFNLHNTVAIGFSNGANIAASIILLRPELLHGAILFRAMVPLIPAYIPDLSNKKILLSAGLNDPIVARIETENLYKIFEKNNAITTLKWQSSGHNRTQEDILIARKWISNNFSDEKQ